MHVNNRIPKFKKHEHPLGKTPLLLTVRTYFLDMTILCEKMMKSDESDEKTILVLYHIKDLPVHPQLLIFLFQLVA